MPGSDGRAASRHWPMRIQRLVADLRGLCDARLQPALLEALEALDQSLYQQAERSRGHLEQQRCFDSRAMVRAHRAGFLRLVSEHVGDSFARLGEVRETNDGRAVMPSLSLLDRDEHEFTAAL